MDVSLTLDQQFNAVVTPKDRKGNPAEIQNPVWASSDETVAQVTAGADGLSALVDTIGVGQANIVVSGDADMGDGVKPITGTLGVTVTKGSATVLEISGTPVDKA
jgi:hypothetical protein